MAPSPGSIHRRPRRDSGAARLWAWACRRRRAWTAAEAADAVEISPRRARAYVQALHEAGLIEQRAEAGWGPAGRLSAEWIVPARCRRLPAPIVVAEPGGGRIAAIRVPLPGDKQRVRAAEQRHGSESLAAALGVSRHTLRRIRHGKSAPLADDPMWPRLARLERRTK